MFWIFVIERFVGSFALDEFAAFFAAGCADDAHSGGARELDGSDSDTAAGSVNQNSVSCARVSNVKERVVGSGVGDVNSCALRKRDAIGKTMKLRCGSEREFGVGSCDGSGEINAITDF